MLLLLYRFWHVRIDQDSVFFILILNIGQLLQKIGIFHCIFTETYVSYHRFFVENLFLILVIETYFVGIGTFSFALVFDNGFKVQRTALVSVVRGVHYACYALDDVVFGLVCHPN